CPIIHLAGTGEASPELARAGLAKRADLEHALGQICRRMKIRPGIVVEDEIEDVASRLEVVERLTETETGGHIIGVDRRLLLIAPEATATVIHVGGDDTPAVLVNIEGTARQEVARTFLQRCLDDPDTVKLIARRVAAREVRAD